MHFWHTSPVFVCLLHILYLYIAFMCVEEKTIFNVMFVNKLLQRYKPLQTSLPEIAPRGMIAVFRTGFNGKLLLDNCFVDL